MSKKIVTSCNVFYILYSTIFIDLFICFVLILFALINYYQQNKKIRKKSSTTDETISSLPKQQLFIQHHYQDDNNSSIDQSFIPNHTNVIFNFIYILYLFLFLNILDSNQDHFFYSKDNIKRYSTAV